MPDLPGLGRTALVRRLRANIPAGVKDGSRIRLAGKGDPGLRGATPGDLYVITRVADSPVFKRSGENLEVEVPLTIPEALLGGVIEVPTLKGSKRLRVARGTKYGTIQRLRGEGPPEAWGKGRGDIRYRFVLDVPASLTAEQTEVVDRLAQMMNGDPRARLFAEARATAEAAELGARRPLMARTHPYRARIEVSSDRGVFMISVAAELAEMHPQTLRMYEARGLIEPKRSPKGTRLYSHRCRSAPAHPGDDRRAWDEPRRGRARVRARGAARLDGSQGRRAGEARRSARGRGRAPRGAATRAAGGDRPLRARRRAGATRGLVRHVPRPGTQPPPSG